MKAFFCTGVKVHKEIILFQMRKYKRFLPLDGEVFNTIAIIREALCVDLHHHFN